MLGRVPFTVPGPDNSAHQECSLSHCLCELTPQDAPLPLSSVLDDTKLEKMVILRSHEQKFDGVYARAPQGFDQG